MEPHHILHLRTTEIESYRKRLDGWLYYALACQVAIGAAWWNAKLAPDRLFAGRFLFMACFAIVGFFARRCLIGYRIRISEARKKRIGFLEQHGFRDLLLKTDGNNSPVPNLIRMIVILTCLGIVMVWLWAPVPVEGTLTAQTTVHHQR